MTRSTGLRQYRACVRCRSKKAKCDFHSQGQPGKPPCAKCVLEGADCVLADSKRGGNYARFRRGARDTSNTPPDGSAAIPVHQGKSDAEDVHESLQNPSDALLILANAAGNNADAAAYPSPSATATDRRESAAGFIQTQTQTNPDRRTSAGAAGPAYPGGESAPSAAQQDNDALNSYPLIRDGTLSRHLLEKLVAQYAESHHHYFPIVSMRVLLPSCLPSTAKDEPFLLTAILIVAMRYFQDEHPDIQEPVWRYMRSLILDVVLGAPSTKRIGSVEGLLLLGEWTCSGPGPGSVSVSVSGSVSESTAGSGRQDDGGEAAAWSIIGLAVRLAYQLRLEDSGFDEHSTKSKSSTSTALTERRRLAWTFTYLCDRQISIRMGQAFWCRGPALSARLTAAHFPSLQARHASEDDLASMVQAQIELTTLFGNAHDILFASRPRTREMMARGDYTKYIDDSIRAADAWAEAWISGSGSGSGRSGGGGVGGGGGSGSSVVQLAPHLRACLTLMGEYLRLYVHAFAFQAVLYRASLEEGVPAARGAAVAGLHGGGGGLPRKIFANSTMASADARHVYRAVEAAESLLRVAVDQLHPTSYLRYMPARFYLYEIHSAVFLHKAFIAGAVSPDQHADNAALLRRFVARLEDAATDADHVAARYARLLGALWLEAKDTTRAAAAAAAGTTTIAAAAATGTAIGATREAPEAAGVDLGAAGGGGGLAGAGAGWSQFTAVAADQDQDQDADQLLFYDGLGGRQQASFTESLDDLFAMPTGFPWDTSFY